MTDLVLPLTVARDASVVGGKAVSLGELSRAGLTVPSGFVVTVSGFLSALAAVDPDGGLRDGVSALPAADLALIAEVSGAFRDRITAAPLPAAVTTAITAACAELGAPEHGVAVRSSATAEDGATASFAGLQDTYLGVSGTPSVLEHVRRCWASLYNDESVAYRRRIGMPETGLAMAVVVQRMIAPRAAGVMFTRSPVTGDRSVVAIEGTWGLGSAVVSGDVTPDSFVISKITGEITTRRIPATGGPCLTDDEIRALAATAQRVERHYGAPQDIEWALLDDASAPGGSVPGGSVLGGAPPGVSAPGGSTASGSAGDRIVLLQTRPETVWATRQTTPVAAPKPRAADHVLALFGKPL